MRRLWASIDRAWWIFWQSIKRPYNHLETVGFVEHAEPDSCVNCGDTAMGKLATTGELMCLACALGACAITTQNEERKS